MQNIENDFDRAKIGKKAAYVGIFGNIFLTTFNFIVGILSGSTALVAEAAHTFSDIATSVISFIGFKIGMKSPTKEHPYGYGRAEPLVGLIIVVFLLVIAYEIFSEAYLKLTIGENLAAPGITAALMAVIGIGINYAMTTYILKAGKKINSPALVADAHHQKVDIYSCGAILIGVVGSQLGLKILDPLVAVFIGLMVIKTALHLARDNINNIMGKVSSETLPHEIKKAAMSVNGIYGVHNVKINNMGPYAAVELHVEAEGDMTLINAHEIAHSVENKIVTDVKNVKVAGVHVCPFNGNPDEDHF